MQAEIDAFQANHTRKVPIGCKWVSKVKFKKAPSRDTSQDWWLWASLKLRVLIFMRLSPVVTFVTVKTFDPNCCLWLVSILIRCEQCISSWGFDPKIF